MWTTPNIIVIILGLCLVILIVVALIPPSTSQKEVRYKDRNSGRMVTEKVAAAAWMQWLYHNPVGKVGLYAVVKRRWLSRLMGHYMDSKWSADRIPNFVQENNIDIGESQKQYFESFNDFFTRQLIKDARPIDTMLHSVVSPADGKVLVYPSVAQSNFIIKGHSFDVDSFLQDSSLSAVFADGAMAVVRLAPTDYHRFHAPVEVQIKAQKVIDGACYSVSPIALSAKPDLFCLNERSYHLMNHAQIGDFVMAEVGATFVGSIVQTFEDSHLQKGQEKGYFKFGGSTIVLLFPKNTIQFDADLVSNSQEGIETAIRMGEKIAEIL